LNLRPPGPEPPQGSEENQSKALNRRWIGEQLFPLIGLLIGLQIAGLADAEQERARQIAKLFKKKGWLVGAVGSKTKTIGISRAYEECEGTLTKSLKRNDGERTGILIAPSSSLVFLDFAKFLRSVFSAHCLGGKVGFGVPILAARMASRCFIYIHAHCNLAMGGSAPALGARDSTPTIPSITSNY
jgi:hypothetical protein